MEVGETRTIGIDRKNRPRTTGALTGHHMPTGGNVLAGEADDLPVFEYSLPLGDVAEGEFMTHSHAPATVRMPPSWVICSPSGNDLIAMATLSWECRKTATCHKGTAVIRSLLRLGL